MIDDEQLPNELMPNSSEAIGIYMPDADDDIEREENEERVTIATALPLMEELMDWFGEQIIAADSIKQVMQTKALTDLDLPAVLHAHDIVRELLEQKRDDLKSRMEDFIARHEEDDG